MKINSIVQLTTSSVVFSVMFSTHAFAQSSTPLSDPEVASVAVVANQIDIRNGELAQKKSKDPQVLKFAQTMIDDHNAVIGQAVALVKKLGVTPKDNSVSQGLLKDAEKTLKSLDSKSGSDFNKAYVNNEVAYHKAVINAVESLLIPEAENAELKQLLQNVLPALKAHLGHAEMLQKDLTK
jgi:putative membrane protein